ncbi:MAG: GIY-YIG nuclease family protein [Bacteroidales bacterium]
MTGSIYKIINNINEKVYIGKTYLSVEERFKQHKNEYLKERSEKRPLYNAMRKYGIENFEVIELGKFKNLEEKEIEFIKEYNSYSNGYNATLGGDGRRYIQVEDSEIVKTYLELKNVKETAERYSICADSVRTILRNNSIEIVRHFNTPKVYCNELKLNFDSVSKCSEYFIKNELTNATNSANVRRGINRVLDGSRKSYCGFTFKVVED